MFLAATKILGTAATGLWAAYNIQVSENLAPVAGVSTILGTAFGSSAGLNSAVQRSSSLSILSAAASAFFILGYLFSPPSGRHPYLLYSAIGAPLVGLLQYSGAQDLMAQAAPKAETPKVETPKAETPTTPATPKSKEESDEEVSQLTGSIYEKVETPKTDPVADKTKSGTDLVADKTNSSTESSTDQPGSLTHKAKLYTRAVAILSSGLYLLGLVGLAGDSL